jgi:O-antigen ligase
MRSIVFALSLVFIFIVPWEGVVRFPLGTLARSLGLVVGALWLATVIIQGRLRKLTVYHIMVCLFVIWNALSLFWSADPNRTLAHLRTWLQTLILIFIMWDLYTTRESILAGLQAYVLGAYVAVGSAVQNYLSGHAYYTNYQRFSPGDTNPDGFGFILALGIPLAWYLAASRRRDGVNPLLKFINYAYIPAAFLGLALSGTRTALIASLVGMAFGLISLARLRIWARIAIFLILTGAIIYLWPQVETLKSFQRLGTTSTELTQGDLNNRTNNWREGLESFVEHPLLGVGSNMYRSVNSLGKVGHNSFVSVLVELGLIGFLLFGIILAIVIKHAWSHPSKWDKSFWLTVFAVWTIGSSTLTWEHRKTTWLFLSFIVASAILARQRGRVTAPVRPGENDAQAIPNLQGGKFSPTVKEEPYSI